MDNQGSVQSKLVGGVFSFIFQGSGIFLRKQKGKKATKNKKPFPGSAPICNPIYCNMGRGSWGGIRNESGLGSG